MFETTTLFHFIESIGRDETLPILIRTAAYAHVRTTCGIGFPARTAVQKEPVQDNNDLCETHRGQ